MSSEGEHDPVKALLAAQATAELWRVQAGKWLKQRDLLLVRVRRLPCICEGDRRCEKCRLVMEIDSEP